MLSIVGQFDGFTVSNDTETMKRRALSMQVLMKGLEAKPCDIELDVQLTGNKTFFSSQET